MKVSGNIIDVVNRKIFKGSVCIENGLVKSIIAEETEESQFILPGFIDAHIHIESSMVVPYEFARVALTHGTVATISDPHEIANVMGVAGVKYMIDNAQNAKLKFHFGAPSCVPATNFETAGAVIDSQAVADLLAMEDIHYLSEMMNYPGVLQGDDEVMKKIAAAKKAGKPIDGHAPGLRGADAEQYIAAGISTDHECFTLDEALDKLKHDMKIIIREGSAAKNFDALHPLIKSHPDMLMFCSDDKHPDDLMVGHINQLVKRSVDLGYDLFDVLHIACVHPVRHYNMNVGLLQPGDPADFIIIDSIESFRVLKTYIDGEKVAEKGESVLAGTSHPIINNFTISAKHPADFQVANLQNPVACIEAIDGELITEKAMVSLPKINGILQPYPEKDILKIAVINRYRESKIAMGFIRNFGIKNGAIASTVAHDSHNIIVVGTDDESMCRAANILIRNKGGLSVVKGDQESSIALPIAGLMSDLSCAEIGEKYARLDLLVKEMGCRLTAPFMTLSFMALLVIPNIKISDLGLFDASGFRFIYQV